jgi:mRNA-degrading endonuclease toxin of MazEF toxin-antitoxin module
LRELSPEWWQKIGKPPIPNATNDDAKNVRLVQNGRVLVRAVPATHPTALAKRSRRLPHARLDTRCQRVEGMVREENDVLARILPE